MDIAGLVYNTSSDASIIPYKEDENCAPTMVPSEVDLDVARGLFQKDAGDDENSMDKDNELQGSPSPIPRQDYGGIIDYMCIPTPLERTIAQEIALVQSCANCSRRFRRMV